MSHESRILLIFFTNCVLLGLAYGLIGTNVHSVMNGGFNFTVSLSRKPINRTGDFVISHFCTGSLISQKSVLTAAHCLVDKGPNAVEIIAGSTNLRLGEKYEVDSWITFDEWNHYKKTRYPQNDIAIITLKGNGITTIPPLQVMTVVNHHLENQEIRITGWGNTKTGRQPIGLRAAYLLVISNEECSLLGTMLKGKKFTVPPNYFCTKAKPWVVSSCGDGGAPILTRLNRLVGINIGICPRVQGYPVNVLNELAMNSHLNIYYYANFIKNATI